MFNSLPSYSSTAVVSEMPPVLHQACADSSVDPRKVWATLLAVQLEELLPWEAVVNPHESTPEQQKLSSRASAWLATQAAECVYLDEGREKLQEAARACVHRCDQHVVRHLYHAQWKTDD